MGSVPFRPLPILARGLLPPYPQSLLRQNTRRLPRAPTTPTSAVTAPQLSPPHSLSKDTSTAGLVSFWEAASPMDQGGSEDPKALHVRVCIHTHTHTQPDSLSHIHTDTPTHSHFHLFPQLFFLVWINRPSVCLCDLGNLPKCGKMFAVLALFVVGDGRHK